MDHDELVELIRSYDLKQNSKVSFARTYSVSISTVDKYVKKYDIPYNKHRNTIKLLKDKLGRFKFLDNECSIQNNSIKNVNAESNFCISNFMKINTEIFKPKSL